MFIIPFPNTCQCGEMVDTPDSKSGIAICAGSSPATGTTPILRTFKALQSL